MNATDIHEERNRLREAIGRVDEVIERLRDQRVKYANELGEIEGAFAGHAGAPASTNVAQ